MNQEARQTPVLTIFLFGAPEIRLDDSVVTKLSAKTEALLFYLAATRRTHRRAALANLLWGETTEKNARANLRKAIQQLRSLLPMHLSIEQQTVGLLDGVAIRVDVVEFDERLQHSEMDEAVKFYRGDFLADFFVRNAPEFEGWQLSQKARLRERMLSALQTLTNQFIAQNELERAISGTQRIVEIEPWREEAHRQLMKLLAQNGQRAAALKQFELCRQILWDEMAVEPSTATQTLFEELKGEATVDAGNAQRHFVTTTDYRLVGRDAEWEILRARWRHLTKPHFVCIAGEAGIGKTRLTEELFMLAEREGQQVARTRSYALEGRLAYAPVADWLRSGPLKRTLSNLDDVWLTEIARLLPELLAENPSLPHPAPIRESWQRKRLFEALAHAFTQSESKLLLVLDDLQWCDGETLEWLHYMLESASKPLLIVGTLRTEEIEQDHALHRIRQQLQHLDRCDDVTLEALTPGATEMLARQVAMNSNKQSRALENVFADSLRLMMGLPLPTNVAIPTGMPNCSSKSETIRRCYPHQAKRSNPTINKRLM